MACDISPQAVVSPKAKIGDGTKIFPFVYIEDDVEIGENCVIFPFVSLLDGTRMGNDNKVHQCTVLSALPQDFEFTSEKTELIIGNNNIIRENVVINRATHAGGQTVIGDDNFIMEGAHVSHDTKIGNRNVIGYGTKIAGCCEIGDGVIFSSSVIENSHTRVGNLAMIQAGTTFSKDVPPYIIVGGKPVEYSGPTSAGFDEKVQKHVANAYRLLFHGKTSVFDSMLQIRDQIPKGPEVDAIIKFLKKSKKGIVTKE